MKKITLLSILVVVSLIYINVNAETNTGPFYQYGVEGISELYAYNWSSYPNSYSEKVVVASYDATENPYLNAFFVPSVNIATQGVSIVYSPNQRLVEGYLYSIGTIVCFDVGLNSIYSYGGQSSMGGNASTALTATPTYQFTTRVRVADESGANCIMYQALIVPQTTGSFYALRMTNSSGYQANMTVWATKVEELGIYTTTIQSMLSSAIQSSGLATASSVSQVQSAVNQVQQEVSDVNDTLTEDHTYNNNPSQQIQGEQDVEDLQEAEEDLFDSLDFSGAEDLDISINPHASSYIWNIVNRLRSMNNVIILIITSALGIGLIKMILNR